MPVGTAMALEERLRAQAPAGDGVEVAWNPEFLREAYAVEDTLRPDRLVFGTHSKQRAGDSGGDLRDPDHRPDPGGALRHRHRRVDQGRRQLVPGDQDQLHQRDGADVPGGRRRRDPARRRDWLSTSGSVGSS